MQDVANTLWAVARMQVVLPDAMLDALASAACKRIRNLRLEEIAMIAYAFGLMQYLPDVLMQALTHRILKMRKSASHQNLSLVLWALGKLEYNPGKQLLAEFAQELHCRAHALPPLSISVTLKAMAKLGYYPPHEFMDAISQECLRRLQFFKNEELSNLMWAFQEISWRDEQLMREIEAMFVSRISRATHHQVGSLIDNLQDLGHRPKMLRAAAQQHGFDVDDWQ